MKEYYVISFMLKAEKQNDNIPKVKSQKQVQKLNAEKDILKIKGKKPKAEISK